MSRFLSMFLVFCIVSVMVSPATACINDRESPVHEKEFKSDYLKQAPPAPIGPPYFENPRITIASGIGIAGILVGAVTGTLAAVRRR